MLELFYFLLLLCKNYAILPQKFSLLLQIYLWHTIISGLVTCILTINSYFHEC